MPTQNNRFQTVDISIFDRSRDGFNPDRLASRRQIEKLLGLGWGVIDVKVSRGDWPLKEVRVGRLAKTRVGDVVEYFISTNRAPADRV